MKKIVSLLIIILFAITLVNAQQQLMESEVPPQVTKSFHEKYPEATVVHWTKSDSEFQVQYKLDEDIFDAFFTSDGNWLRTEYTVDSEDLPDAIVNAKKSSKYKVWDISTVKVIESPKAGKNYRLEMYDMDYNQAQVVYDVKGNIIK